MKRNRAIVIGAGAAGCMAARVLSEHFDSVLILEKDLQASTETFLRKGIPQAHHVHNVLLQGNRILARLFPDLFGADFDEAGSPGIEVIHDQHRLGPFGWDPVYRTGWIVRGHSRQLLDRTLIKQTLRIPNVELRFGHQVQELLTYKSGGVCGVRVDHRDADGQVVTESLTADLVIETSGRGTRLEQWLKALGAGDIPIRRVISPDAYSTRVYKYSGPAPKFKQFAISRKPGSRERGAYILAIEGNRWMVTLVGGTTDFPPADEPGFIEFARSLDTDDVFRFISQATPEGQIHPFRKMENVCRFLHEVSRWPDGLLVLGDALCAFNPVRGQGITTAAVSAELLEKALKAKFKPGWEQKFHRQVVRVLAGPWLFSVNEDLNSFFSASWPKRLLLGLRHRLRVKLLMTLQGAATNNPEIHLRLFQVQNLMRPVQSLYDPRLLFKALRTPKNSGPSRGPEARATGHGNKASTAENPLKEAA